jgi:hypothetical protein
MSARPPLLPCRPADWACPGPLPPADFAHVRRRMVLDHFKWDPQVGDIATLAPFPLVLPAATVQGLAALAEALAAETDLAERELLHRPDLLGRLGLPRRIRRILAGRSAEPPPAAARVLRFDFHPTADGWRVSEANSDVPGGYAESSYFPRLMAEHYPGLRPAGDPARSLADAIHERAGGPGRAGLLAAPGYMEDQQVVACLAAELRRRGWATMLGHPGQVDWDCGQARLRSPEGAVPLDIVVRFFQGEWLARVRDPARWRPFFRGGRTPVCNPGSALFAESKRFPLVWDELSTPLPTWRALLPQTRDPRDVDWRRDTDWLLKAAFGNNGDEVIDRAAVSPRIWRRASWEARLWPGAWVAQRRFAALPVETPAGPMFPCLGVYTVDGQAAGIYGRLAAKPLIDYAAVDVAILVPEDARGGSA